MITVIATISLRPGTRDAFLNEFHQIVPLVRQEPGCLHYAPMIDAETPLENQHRDPHRVTIVETWDSVETLQAHLQAPHMQAYRPKVRDFVKDSELRVLDNA